MSNDGLVHEKQMVDLDGYRRIPGLQNFCEYLLHAGIDDQKKIS
jgi:hypothetical protein